MYTNLSLRHFKCFSRAEISLKPLTMLTGLNSSGKSSVMQAIRIIAGGELLHGYGNCVSTLGDKAKISLELSGHQHQCIIEKDNTYFEPILPKSNVLSNNLHYISADRLGPLNFLPYKRRADKAGEKGENVLSYLETYDSGVPEILRRKGYEEFSSVKEQIRAWMEIISPGLKFDYKTIEESDIALFNFSGFRPVDVGFGLSYTLPAFKRNTHCNKE